jgi:hypothetical protein
MLCDDTKGNHWAILTETESDEEEEEEAEEDEKTEGEYDVKPNTKAGFNQSSARQSTNYGNNQFPATNAFRGGSKFTHTNAGVGQWWEVKFDREYWVDRVRILNRRDCCGGRLARTKVFIGDELCGQVEPGTSNGRWYTVKCQEPVMGEKVRLVTT